MKICLDTNVLLQLFSVNPVCQAIRRALFDGRLELAFSNEMLFEYEEVVTRSVSAKSWQRFWDTFETLKYSRGNVIRVEPTFRFGVIVVDPDDNKFVDCAITAGADFIVTEDKHFAALTGAGYRPQPITPREFTQRYLERG